MATLKNIGIEMRFCDARFGPDLYKCRNHTRVDKFVINGWHDYNYNGAQICPLCARAAGLHDGHIAARFGASTDNVFYGMGLTSVEDDVAIIARLDNLTIGDKSDVSKTLREVHEFNMYEHLTLGPPAKASLFVFGYVGKYDVFEWRHVTMPGKIGIAGPTAEHHAGHAVFRAHCHSRKAERSFMLSRMLRAHWGNFAFGIERRANLSYILKPGDLEVLP